MMKIIPLLALGLPFAVASTAARAQAAPPLPLPIVGQGYHVVRNWSFGTAPGNTVAGPQLWNNFHPSIHYDKPPGSFSLYGGWDRYRGLAENYVFTPGSLLLLADIPANGGLFDGGINGSGLFSWDFFQFRYGYVEMRVRFPPFEKAGLWPAGWLIPRTTTNDDDVELDLFEVMNKTDAPAQYLNSVFMTVHSTGSNVPALFKDGSTVTYESSPASSNDQYGAGRYTLPAGSIYTDFHTYAVDWEPDSATFYVDNHMVMSRRFRWVLKDGSVAPPAYVILNMACGGIVPGWPNSAAEFPAAVEAQYIRIWQKPGEYPG